MRLTKIILPDLGRTELRIGARAIDFDQPIDAVMGWRVLVRGPAVILLPPKGPGHEFARSACVLSWDSAKPEDYDKLTTYTSEPLARRPLAESEPEPEPTKRDLRPGSEAIVKAGAR